MNEEKCNKNWPINIDSKRCVWCGKEAENATTRPLTTMPAPDPKPETEEEE